MPYKDPERRRTFHREYKRRRRAELRVSTPSQPLTGVDRQKQATQPWPGRIRPAIVWLREQGLELEEE